MKTKSKNSNHSCPINKKGLGCLFGCTHCMINTLIFVLVCVGLTMMVRSCHKQDTVSITAPAENQVTEQVD